MGATQQTHSELPAPFPTEALVLSPPLTALLTFTTRMYPSGGRRLISFFSCSTARTRSMTLLYTVSSVRSRLAVGAGWMDCWRTGMRRDQKDRGGKEGKTKTMGNSGQTHPPPRCRGMMEEEEEEEEE